MALQRWWPLLIGVAVAPALGAQTAPAPFASLRGDWVGEGTLLGRPARFAMRWQERNGFATLLFTSDVVDSLGGVSPALRAAAVYRTDAARPEGIWLDSRGVRVELAWTSVDSALVVTWTAPRETGRTTYRLRASGTAEVVDEVRSGDAWRVFGTAVYRREAP